MTKFNFDRLNGEKIAGKLLLFFMTPMHSSKRASLPGAGAQRAMKRREEERKIRATGKPVNPGYTSVIA